jgi:hypothetical protein
MCIIDRYLEHNVPSYFGDESLLSTCTVVTNFATVAWAMISPVETLGVGCVLSIRV